jgi:hypothetical protein
MIEAERAIAARALDVGWKDAFLEYLSPTADGFRRRSQPGSARASRSPRIPIAPRTCIVDLGEAAVR